MKRDDFLNARREGMEFQSIYEACGEVLSVVGTVRDNAPEAFSGVWDERGRFYAFLRQPFDADDFLVRQTVGRVAVSWNGRVLVRTPWFDLKF